MEAHDQSKQHLQQRMHRGRLQVFYNLDDLTHPHRLLVYQHQNGDLLTLDRKRPLNTLQRMVQAQAPV